MRTIKISVPRKLRAAIATLCALVFILPTPVSAASALLLVAQLGLIGYSYSFVRNVMESETCRTTGEAVAEAGIQTSMGLMGTVAGGLIGATAGSEDGLGGTLIGGAAGGMLGGMLGQSLGGAMGGDAGAVAAPEVTAANRDYAATFEYNACKLILASNTIVDPLLKSYAQIITDNCGLSAEQFAVANAAQMREAVACANNSSGDARDISLQLIRVNQATCFAIDQLGDNLVREAALNRQPGESLMPFPPPADSCEGGNPADVWGQFVNQRLDRD